MLKAGRKEFFPPGFSDSFARPVFHGEDDALILFSDRPDRLISRRMKETSTDP